MTENKEKFPIYRLTPYHIEKRGNLKMLGNESVVEYQQLKNNLMIIHVKENMTPDAMVSLAYQLKSVFGEETLLMAFKDDVSFFVAAPMSPEEVKIFNTMAQNELEKYIDTEVKKIKFGEKHEC